MLISPSTVKSLIILYGKDITLDELYSKICQEEGLDKESTDTQCAQEVKSENSQTIKGMTPLTVDASIKYRRNHKLVGA